MYSLPDFAAATRGRLIVSAQAPAGHPLRDTHTIAHLAQAAASGGAAAIRCGGYGGVEDIAAVAAVVQVPVIGLTKEGDTGVYITPTVASAQAVVAAGAQVVAFDATARPRPDGASTADMVHAIHAAGALAMADIATAQEAVEAHAAGVDIISTTLAGYTPDRAATQGPDLELLEQVRELVPEAFLIGEGRFHTPQHLERGFELGADAIIIGTAITDVAWVTRQFAALTPVAAPVAAHKQPEA
ncbi:putative N-acetylmannosamine-6-phosphate 2-epimerase [Corynebacterium lizhenjunii]|uniref:putative N-acetylmannosamine-6-phosphate 2-epimerase n=1 Tax=Corynebacterium lizhenjunii TaxID=2709394 RepID=UPI0013ECC160|nr:putative N-acetylmannosamine-6-phosphate 2-epimerase [Corynebacterium lizhenjunii]